MLLNTILKFNILTSIINSYIIVVEKNVCYWNSLYTNDFFSIKIKILIYVWIYIVMTKQKNACKTKKDIQKHWFVVRL